MSRMVDKDTGGPVMLCNADQMTLVQETVDGVILPEGVTPDGEGIVFVTVSRGPGCRCRPEETG